MKNKNILGIIYDLLQYNVIHFNKDNIKAVWEDRFDNINSVFYNYNLLEKYKLYPKDYFYTFFYYDGQDASPLSQYFYNNFDPFKHDFNDFILLIKNSDRFKEFLFKYYFKSDEKYKDFLDGDKQTVIMLFLNLEYNKEFVSYLIHVFFNFDNCIIELIDYLENLIIIIKKLHIKLDENYIKLIAELSSNETEEKIKKFANINNNVNFNKQFFSISYLNPFVIMMKDDKKELNHCFIFGFRYKETLDIYIKYNFVNARTIGQNIGHEIKYEILEALKKEEHTISQLSRILNVSNSSVTRFIDGLYSEFIIILSKTVGNEKYYKINPQYFSIAQNIMNTYLGSFFTYNTNTKKWRTPSFIYVNINDEGGGLLCSWIEKKIRRKLG